MRWYNALSVTAAVLLAAACADTVVTAPSLQPRGPRFDAAGPITGSIKTTLADCQVVNGNVQYVSKEDVYLNGGGGVLGPLAPAGTYWVKVTEPDGTVLGTSLSADYTVTDGQPNPCLQVWALVNKASDGTQGYDDTNNPGGEYKLWVCGDASFVESSCKTDNFKVRGENPPPPPQALLTVQKFYDANANGVKDGAEQFLEGWAFTLQPFIGPLENHLTTYAAQRDVGYYTATELLPIETNWHATTPTSVSFTLTTAGYTVTFGNYCTRPSGGLTIGFWSNKNGQALITSNDLQALRDLNLRNANGTNFDPTTNTQYKNWLLAATATNMAYMLSAQLSGLVLNVRHGFVDGNAFVLGFNGTVNQLIAAADASLAANGSTVAQDATRAYQETLKNYIDALNNGGVVVPTSPCTFTFAAQ